MKKYRSHKVVEAAPIERCHSAGTQPENNYVVCGGSPREGMVFVPVEFFARGMPVPGDYLVRYEPDGYLSWSPKAVFEAGYSAVPPDAPRGDIGHTEA